MKTKSGHMAQGEATQLKFERNPCINFRDNQCHRRTMDDRRRMDGRRTKSHTISSADRVKQSYIVKRDRENN